MDKGSIYQYHTNNTPFEKYNFPFPMARKLPKEIKESVKCNAIIKNTVSDINGFFFAFDEEECTDKNAGEKIDKTYNPKDSNLI